MTIGEEVCKAARPLRAKRWFFIDTTKVYFRGTARRTHDEPLVAASEEQSRPVGARAHGEPLFTAHKHTFHKGRDFERGNTNIEATNVRYDDAGGRDGISSATGSDQQTAGGHSI